MEEKPRTPEDRARLARRVKHRRQQLDLTQTQLVAAGGPSVSVISRIESGKLDSYDGKSILRLERVLQWESGSIDAILDGRDPTPVGEVTTEKTLVPPSALPTGSRSGLASMSHDQLAALVEDSLRKQEELAQEVKGLRAQVEAAQIGQNERGHGESGNRASA